MPRYTKPEYDYKNPVFKNRAYIRYAQEHKEMYEILHQSAAIRYEITKTVSPLHIPTEYYVYYQIKSIVGIEDDQQPIYGHQHTVRLELPVGYPLKPVLAYMMTDAWHPNIKSEGKLKGRICANSTGFGRNFTLPQMVLRVGEILQYQNYLAEFKPPFPEDPKVAEWVLNFAEPQGIVSLEKRIFIDNTALLERREEEEEVNEEQAPADEQQTEEKGGFSISKRGDKKDPPADPIGQAVPDDPGPTPMPPEKAAEDPPASGGFQIRRRE